MNSTASDILSKTFMDIYTRSQASDIISVDTGRSLESVDLSSKKYKQSALSYQERRRTHGLNILRDVVLPFGGAAIIGYFLARFSNVKKGNKR